MEIDKARNPNMNTKPAVLSWFKDAPEAKDNFMPLLGFLEANYQGSKNGYINMASQPEYRFNSGAQENDVKVIASKKSLKG